MSGSHKVTKARRKKHKVDCASIRPAAPEQELKINLPPFKLGPASIDPIKEPIKPMRLRKNITFEEFCKIVSKKICQSMALPAEAIKDETGNRNGNDTVDVPSVRKGAKI